MAEDPTEIVRVLSAETLAEFPGGIYSIVSEDIVFLSWDGHVYVGHEGLASWFEAQLREWQNIGFREESSENVGGGWALTKGDIVLTDREGRERIQPGYWLAHIQNGKIAATLYYRTLDEARSALKTERRRD